jgi:hypothetical protein
LIQRITTIAYYDGTANLKTKAVKKLKAENHKSYKTQPQKGSKRYRRS